MVTVVPRPVQLRRYMVQIRGVAVLKIGRPPKTGSPTVMMRRRARSRLLWCGGYCGYIFDIVICGGGRGGVLKKFAF